MSENCTVYMHRFPNGKVYIGITEKEPEVRWKNGRGYQSQFVYKAIKKYGWQNIEHIVLFSGLDKLEAEEREIGLISLYKATDPRYGYNIENGGNFSGKHSELTCRKISESKKGWNPSAETRKNMGDSRRGKTFSEEHKRKLSECSSHHPMSEENKKRLIEINTGRVVSDETRQKLRNANLGKKHTQEHKNKISASGKIAQRKCKSVRVLQVSLDGEEIKMWDCMTDITHDLGINQAHICACCKGKRNKAGGFMWRYADK